eukprot:CAMPEP_0113832070 /NCGR_PEP_ID=MMETSP0328-20130328/7184_1 /TAXON_ID=39455 /ORGANISM="Alexandrium minutum" /LENGTH=54 /DNA_ID=CAMNT_0000800261 /DNA_START=6 /DNA_END=167 /DNA_ORIENTATION=+ /assembly_acc=CAM_ASM_000350
MPPDSHGHRRSREEVARAPRPQAPASDWLGSLLAAAESPDGIAFDTYNETLAKG